jgi:hypothetical protein
MFQVFTAVTKLTTETQEFEATCIRLKRLTAFRMRHCAERVVSDVPNDRGFRNVGNYTLNDTALHSGRPESSKAPLSKPQIPYITPTLTYKLFQEINHNFIHCSKLTLHFLLLTSVAERAQLSLMVLSSHPPAIQ